MSKSQSHPSGPDGDDDGTNTMDLPPTYAAATTTSPHTIPFLPPSPTVTSIFTSPLTSHLQTLPVRMREMQQAHYSDQASRDLEYITLLIPHVEAFLSDLVSMPRTPPVAELTLVPACAVPRGWAMTGAAERRREGEVVRVVRVEGYGKVVEAMSKGEKGGPGRDIYSGDDEEDEDGDGYTSSLAKGEAGFDEWGRFDDAEASSHASTSAGAAGLARKGWYFRDEQMARRLATYLRPEPNLERKRVQAKVVENKNNKKEEKKPSSGGGGGGGGGGGWLWGRSKSQKQKEQQQQQQQQQGPTTPGSGPAGLARRSTNSSVVVGGEGEGGGLGDRVSMAVRADEVTFRKENGFGVWESLNGLGIVVTVSVRRV